MSVFLGSAVYGIYLGIYIRNDSFELGLYQCGEQCVKRDGTDRRRAGRACAAAARPAAALCRGSPRSCAAPPAAGVSSYL